MLPNNFVAVNAGNRLGELQSMGDLYDAKMLLLGACWGRGQGARELRGGSGYGKLLLGAVHALLGPCWCWSRMWDEGEWSCYCAALHSGGMALLHVQAWGWESSPCSPSTGSTGTRHAFGSRRRAGPRRRERNPSRRTTLPPSTTAPPVVTL